MADEMTTGRRGDHTMGAQVTNPEIAENLRHNRDLVFSPCKSIVLTRHQGKTRPIMSGP